MSKAKLDEHLIVKTRPLADGHNVVLWKNYRVTVLQDRLFRIEQSEDGTFRDGATQSVWYRDMPPQDFKVELSEGKAVITTAACKLILRKARADCRIVLGGKTLKIENGGNLKGTYRTLDLCNGSTYMARNGQQREIELEGGVCSRTGVAVLDDSHSLALSESGEIALQKNTETDEYVFAYGDAYRDAVKALYLITGHTPVVPRFAFGNWWSRYYAYTDEEYLRVINAFEERDVPISIATIDMDWHYSTTVDEDFGITEKGRNTPEFGGNNGWTGYSWNKKLFPDYKAFLATLNGKNLKITLNLHPAQGIRWWEDSYVQMAEAMGQDPASGHPVAFDLSDPAFTNAYFSVLHKPYEQDGVRFWWIDWQQGTQSKVEGLDPLWTLNHYHFLDNAKGNAAPLILSRYAGVGSHRYPIGFSGDSFITWKTLQFLPYFTATASNVGYTWWSHDIGGHMYGEQKGELFVRHLQFGVFSPMNRLHCCNYTTTSKEPWVYRNGTGLIAEKWLRLRHDLIPFLYTYSHRTHRDGVALIEPLYYEWKQPEAYRAEGEYLFGGAFIVAPVTSPRRKDGYARTKVWLPQGRWTDIFTGDEYISPEGGRYFTLLRDLDTIPVLAKAGAILPLSGDKGNSVGNPKLLNISVYNGDGAFTLVEDEEEGDGRAETQFTAQYAEEGGKGTQTLTIKNGSVQREMIVRFKNIKRGTVKVYCDNEELGLPAYLTDSAAAKLSVEKGRVYRVECSFPLYSELEALLARAERVLLQAEEENLKKVDSWDKISKVKSVDEYRAAVEGCELVKVVKERLLETL